MTNSIFISVTEALDSYSEGVSELFDEMYWEDGLSVKGVIKYLRHCAKVDGYTLREEADAAQHIADAYESVVQEIA